MKKEKKDSLQSKKDRLTKGLGDIDGASSSKQAVDDFEGGSFIAPPNDMPQSVVATVGSTIAKPVPVVDRTTAEDSGTRPEGPHGDVV